MEKRWLVGVLPENSTVGMNAWLGRRERWTSWVGDILCCRVARAMASWDQNVGEGSGEDVPC